MGTDGTMPRVIALLVVDMQEDFCPPDGALAVPGGRDIIPALNALLAHPRIALKLATLDYHPPTHVSFAANHGPGAVPFLSTTTITNPLNPAETYETRLWPVHCVAGTPGAALARGLAVGALHGEVRKGTDARVEMYSAFRAPLRDPPLPTAVSALGDMLRAKGVTDVLVGGLAGDYCVKCTALDAAEDGWRTYVLEDAVRCVGGEEAWVEVRAELEGRGVRIVDSQWVRENLLADMS